MVTTLVNFEDWAALREWESSMETAGWTNRDFIIHYQSDGRPLAIARAGIYAYFENDLSEAHQFMRQAYGLVTDKLERLLILALSSSLQSVSGDDEDPFGTAQRQIDVLDRQLDEARSLPSRGTLRFEVEIRLLQSLMHCHALLGHQQELLYRASEALQIAQLLDIPRLKADLALKYGWALQMAGQYHRSIVEQGDLTPGNPREIGTRLGYAYMNIGQLELAVKALREALLATSQDDEALTIRLAFIQGAFGEGDPQWTVAFPLSDDQEVRQLHAVANLIRADQVLPSARSDQERALLYDTALEAVAVTARRPKLTPTDQAYEAWLRARAFIGRSTFGLAGQELRPVSGAFEIANEDLVTRTLLAGARLDLALRLGSFALEMPSTSVAEFRAVFALAEKLKQASPEGLAALLWRWHPQVAALLAVMPDPLRYFQDGMLNIVKVGNQSRLRNNVIPGWYVAQQTLAYWGVPVPPASWSGNEAPQQKALLERRGSIDVVRSIVSGPHLLVGLLKLGDGKEFRNAARTVVTDYGLLPKSTTSKMPVEAAEANELLELMLAELLSVQDFSEQMLNF